MQQRTAEQIENVPHSTEKIIEAVPLVPGERLQQRTAKQIVDAPQVLEEIFDMARTVEQIIDVFGRNRRGGEVDPQVRVHQRVAEQL